MLSQCIWDANNQECLNNNSHNYEYSVLDHYGNYDVLYNCSLNIDDSEIKDSIKKVQPKVVN